MLMMSNAFSSPPARGRSLDFIGASHPRLYLHLRHLCRTSSSARCQIECHKECQVACQNIYQRRYQTECQIKCQIECQNTYIYDYICRKEYQIECQNICQPECQIQWQKMCQIEYQLVVITRRKSFAFLNCCSLLLFGMSLFDGFKWFWMILMICQMVHFGWSMYLNQRSRWINVILPLMGFNVSLDWTTRFSQLPPAIRASTLIWVPERRASNNNKDRGMWEAEK